MDYKAKITAFFPLPRKQRIEKYLDDTYPGWRDEEATIAAGRVLRAAIGNAPYDRLDVEITEEAEQFIVEHFLE